MSSSTSSSSADPTVTVVIGSNAPPERLAACLEALDPQRDGVEVLVHEGHASPTELRERFPWASFVITPGALIPHHWRDGIDAARGDVVALTISQMIPAPDWIERIRELQGRFPVVAGAIDPAPGLRASDWAEYFCRYAPDMRPFDARESLDLPGDNAAYHRATLETVRAEYRDGFWEPFVHRALAKHGVEHWQLPELIVFQGRSAGGRAFTAQRLAHGWKYGRQRAQAFSTPRKLVGLLAAPIVPFLMTWRVLGRVFRKRRYRARALATLPLIFWFNVAWAYAEARGTLEAFRR